MHETSCELEFTIRLAFSMKLQWQDGYNLLGTSNGICSLSYLSAHSIKLLPHMNCGPQFVAVWSWPICRHVYAAVRRRKRRGRGDEGDADRVDVRIQISRTILAPRNTTYVQQRRVVCYTLRHSVRNMTQGTRLHAVYGQAVWGLAGPPGGDWRCTSLVVICSDIEACSGIVVQATGPMAVSALCA